MLLPNGEEAPPSLQPLASSNCNVPRVFATIMQVAEELPSLGVSESSDKGGKDGKGLSPSPAAAGIAGKQYTLQPSMTDTSSAAYTGSTASVLAASGAGVIGLASAAEGVAWQANSGGGDAVGPPAAPDESLSVSASDCPSAGSSGASRQMRQVLEVLQAQMTRASDGQWASAAAASLAAAGGGPSSSKSLSKVSEGRGVPVLGGSSSNIRDAERNLGGGARMRSGVLNPSPAPAALGVEGPGGGPAAVLAGAGPPHGNELTNLLLHRQMESLRGELVTAAESQWEVHGELGKGAFGVVYKVGG